MSDTQTLAQISTKIKGLEQNSIRNVIEIGRLLHEASDLCKHGEYLAWLKAEFSWSHDTCLNYRNAFELSQCPVASDFDTWDISLSAFYLVAKYLKTEYPVPQAAGKAIIDAARQRRVNYRTALAIYWDINSGGPSGTMMSRAPYVEPDDVVDPDVDPDVVDPPDDKPPPPRELTRAMDVVRRYSLLYPDNWCKVGAISWSEFIAMLQATFRAHFGGDPVKEMADAAEARAAEQRAKLQKLKEA